MNCRNDHVLLLHLGTAKTGTTAIQELLRLNRDKLVKLGWCYPDLHMDLFGKPDSIEDSTGGVRPNGLFLIELMRGKYGKVSGFYLNTLWGHLLRHLQNENVIISCESLFDNLGGYSMFERLTDIKKRYSNIKILVYLRRQDLWIESSWNQAVEGNTYYTDIHDFMKNYPRASHSPDYLSKIREIESVVGKDNIIIRVYEKGQFAGVRGDVLSDLAYVLNDMGCDMNLTEFVMPDQINGRLSGDTLSIALQFLQEYQRYATVTPPEIPEIFRQINDVFTGGDGAYFTREERVSIMEKYKGGNEVIAREYLGRDDGRLFYDTNTDMPLWNKRLFSKTEQELIRIIAQQMGRMAQRTEGCDNNNPILQHMTTIKDLVGVCVRYLCK